jgi:enoyl-CoA hydratase
MTGGLEGLRVERRGPALVATVDRPASRNAISRATMRALRAFADQASADPGVRAAIVTGAGQDVFVSGGDLRDFAELANREVGASEVLAMGECVAALERCAVPVLAAVQGVALGGGCELVLACDLAILERHASLWFRQAAMGLSTGWGGGTRLIERVGAMVAARVLLVGDPVDAEQALRIGLVTEVVATGCALDRCLEIAEAIAAHPRASVAGLKRMIFEVRRARRGDAHEREAEVFASLWGGAAHLAAMSAFFGRKG